MSSHRAARPPRSHQGAPATARERLLGFLVDRLTEDLALVWARDRASAVSGSRPGMAAQVTVLDDLLTTLRSGDLPSRRELRIVLHGYAAHPDYDPAWTRLLVDGAH